MKVSKGVADNEADSELQGLHRKAHDGVEADTGQAGEHRRGEVGTDGGTGTEACGNADGEK